MYQSPISLCGTTYSLQGISLAIISKKEIGRIQQVERSLKRKFTRIQVPTGDEVCQNKLFGATYGQGLWKSDLKDPGNTAPVTCFSSESTNGCLGSSFKINDYSAFAPTGWTWTITPRM